MDDTSEPRTPVTVSLDDLRTGQTIIPLPISIIHQTKKSQDVISFDTLEQAFGPTSLGILLVSSLPPTFLPLRHQLLSYASHLANLPETELGPTDPPTFPLSKPQP